LAFLRSFFKLMLLALLVSACAKTEEDAVLFEDLKNIPYASYSDSDGMIHLSLDIYYPDRFDGSKRLPMIMIIHGGSYLVGSKEASEGLCHELSGHGFAVAAIDYRKGWDHSQGCNSDPKGLVEAEYRALQDARAALRFLVHNSARYSLDTAWFFVGGRSAGGSVALNVCYKDEQFINEHRPWLIRDLGGLHTSGNDLEDPFSIKGIMGCWGSLEDTNLIRRETAVPFIGFHGSEDILVPVEAGNFLGCTAFPSSFGSLSIYSRLHTLSVPVVTHILRDEGHEPGDIFSETFLACNTACFFQGLMSGKPASGLYNGLNSSCR